MFSMKNVVEESSTNVEMVEMNLNKSRTAGNSFKNIYTLLNQSEDEILSIHSSMKEINDTAGKVKETMDIVEAMNQENGASIQQIATSIKELSIQSHDLSVTAGKLLEMSRNQDILFAQLTLKDEE